MKTVADRERQPLSMVKASWRWRQMKQDKYLYLLLAPAILFVFVFVYMPLPGIMVAFKDYDVFKGFWGSDWAGLKFIREVFELPMIGDAIGKTLLISTLTLIVCFPAPIVLALLLNELRLKLFKRITQTLLYLPHFLSWISVIGIAYAFYSIYGPLNDIRLWLFGGDTERIMFLSNPHFFIPNVLLLSLWKETGWSTVIFLAAIASVDPQLYEAAYMDGAGKLRQTFRITLPTILPTVMIMLIFQLGNLFQSNFELIYGLQNPFVNTEVISTLIYKQGIQQGAYALSTALGFIQGLIAFVLTVAANSISKKLTSSGIW
ncbi:putative aldouronate transport system permease protein [Paenibacillus sp. UNC496MF]|uniref:ABC transporter permease n=1 Tax=Paenibacillus sp. UNC496MF TaxID=1502753 RepID=UPI0008F0276D|nr:ABC transporter permease subunit [Paenibacillus sp. UNC496MF]SFJ93021.1 putative aldouronate transport system permease protein [Paenibacillus sp. UNC496MF]